jgi:hypothetical protein
MRSFVPGAANAGADQPQSPSVAGTLAHRVPGRSPTLSAGSARAAQVTIIGNVCPAAISTYLARLYPRERDRVRLVIARLGTDPAIVEPTPIPVLQAAQLLAVPPSASAVVASTPADIRSAGLAGARAIAYTRHPPPASA